MFGIGDYVIKPNTGICEVGNVVMLDMSGTGEKQYYELHPLKDRKVVIYVGVDVDRSRLRPAMNRKEALKFLKCCESIKAACIENEKYREKQYKDAFRSNEAEELVAILKDMIQRGRERLAAGKKITATDTKYYREAHSLLLSELTAALEEETEHVAQLFNEAIGAC